MQQIETEGGEALNYLSDFIVVQREREETNSLNTLVYKKNLLDYCRKDAKRETRSTNSYQNEIRDIFYR